MPKNRRTEPLVEVVNYGTAFEADVALAKLQANGVEASVQHSAPGGGTYGSAIFGDHTIVVFESDLEIAETLLAPEE